MRTTRVRLLKTQFGDGYQQVGTDGLNAVVERWQLRWNALTRDEYRQLDRFLARLAGIKPFHWEPPQDAPVSPRQWRCERWSTTTLTNDLYNVVATFEQDFSL